MENINKTKTAALDMKAIYDDSVATTLYWELLGRLEKLRNDPKLAGREQFVAKNTLSWNHGYVS